MKFNLSKKNLYGIKTSHTNNLVSHVLLRTFGLGSEQGGDSSTGKGSTDTVTASLSELVNYGRVLLAETTRVQSNVTSITFQPLVATKRDIRESKSTENESSQAGVEHDEQRIVDELE